MTFETSTNQSNFPNPSGWTTPQPETLPQPTYWPVVMAAGLVLLMWAIVTSWAVAALGALLFCVSLAGWIRDLLSEAQNEKRMNREENNDRAT